MKTEVLSSSGDTTVLFKTVVYCGGMWSENVPQCEFLKGRLAMRGYNLICTDYPGHGERFFEDLSGRSFNDFVDDKVAEIKRIGYPVPIIGHSMGVMLGIQVACKIPELVTKIIGINPGPQGPIGVPMVHWPRFINFGYAKAIVSGEAFDLDEKDVRFVLDGTKTVIGPESGRVLRETSLGISVPRLKNFKRGFLINTVSDHVVPQKTARKIVEFHGTPSITLPGGHFAFCDPLYREDVALQVESALLES